VNALAQLSSQGKGSVSLAPSVPRPGNSRSVRSLWAAGLLLLGLSAQATPALDPVNLSLEQLLGITVTGAAKYEQRQSDVAAAVSVLTRQDIKTYGWRTLDDALASLPGVYRTYDRQYAYLGTRGFSVLGDFNTRILLTINGNRVNDAVYDQAYIGRDFPLDLDLVERIEFIPGPGGAVYGQNAMFGVVNVVTRTGASLSGVQVSLATQRPQRAHEGRVTWGRRLEGGMDVLRCAPKAKTGSTTTAPPV
jgi:outer membrane receptor protein involved in Fe transport